VNETCWDESKFVANLREVGRQQYHDKHPFHLLMNQGKLSRAGVAGWVINRFYYQRNIPCKDAAIISNCPLREVRKIWIHRIIDHDGNSAAQGGIEAWTRLGEACGFSREELFDDANVESCVRSAVNSYVDFARAQPWPVAVASSLTELFAPDLMATRLAAFQKHYDWIDSTALDYFRRRLSEARRDSGEALQLTVVHCSTAELQQAAVNALQFKCGVLWSMLDAIQQRYGSENPPA
jgi:pyrroloquinoline-quinone synthase